MDQQNSLSLKNRQILENCGVQIFQEIQKKQITRQTKEKNAALIDLKKTIFQK